MNTLKGIFKPLNPSKYRGDANNIVYRSSWEMRCMSRFDNDNRVVWWSSEEMNIQYYNPVKKRPARYFPDFIIGIKNADGTTRTLMIEVKPHQETLPPKKPATTKDKRKIRRFIYESATFSINQAKWAAARKFCTEKGIGFAIFTEYEIGIKPRPVSNK